ncbi:MAG TPA: DUF4124 domain-containing protein [Usitatibacter sp.]|nr:DUF4124 domain-containing protein [Usitatibacter sp.]
MRKIPIILAALAALYAIPAAAAIYKWVDKDGTTHYTETPPPQGTDARELPIAETPAASAPQQPAAEGGDAKAAVPASKNADGSAHESADEEKRAADLRKTYCSLAKRNVTVLDSPDPVVELNTQGEPMTLTEEQRSAALADAKRRVQTYCNP